MPETEMQQALARIYSLPTREELAQIISQYVTKEVFRLEIEGLRKEYGMEIDSLRDEIEEMKEQPSNHRAMIAWALGIAVSGVVVLGFLASHLSWK
jgi:hypothetical protein